jgi:FkbM family methyltransferase
MIDLGKYLRDPGRAVRKLRWRRLYHGPRREVTLDTWNGRLTFDSRDRYIGKYLYVDRAYEPKTITNTIEALARLSPKSLDGNGTLVDVGANIGMITTAMLTKGWFARAVCVEPSPANVRLLRKNIAQNGLNERTRVIGVALSDAPGELAFELSERNLGDNRLRAGGSAVPGAYREERRPAITVPVETMDRALAAAGVAARDVALLWMDVQGYEAKCLAGAPATLAAGMPVVMEFWPYGLLRAGTTRDDFVTIVGRHFTRCFRILDDRVVPLSIPEVGALFDEVHRPNKMTQLLFTRDAP